MTIEDMIKEVDNLLEKNSWEFSNLDEDRLLLLSYKIVGQNWVDIENNEITKLKTNNAKWATILLLKWIMNDGKKAHTDTTAKAEADKTHKDEDIKYLSNKYQAQTIDRKLKLIERKLVMVWRNFK